MKQVHHQEKEQFKKLFNQENIDRFEDRYKVLEAFLQSEHHFTDAEIVERLRNDGHSLDLEFVRNTLDMMCHYGFAQANRFDNGQVRYEHRHLGQHHDHMICTKCRKIVEFENDQMEALQRQIANSHGFHMLQHRMEIYGICSDCLEEQVHRMPLVAAPQGERLIIRDFIGGSTARMRLLTMGLRIGDEIEVLTNIHQGQVVISVDYHRYALGRGLAQKILVEPVHGPVHGKDTENSDGKSSGKEERSASGGIHAVK